MIFPGFSRQEEHKWAFHTYDPFNGADVPSDDCEICSIKPTAILVCLSFPLDVSIKLTWLTETLSISFFIIISCAKAENQIWHQRKKVKPSFHFLIQDVHSAEKQIHLLGILSLKVKKPSAPSATCLLERSQEGSPSSESKCLSSLNVKHVWVEC